MTRVPIPPLRRPLGRRLRDRPPERPSEVICAFVRTLERLGRTRPSGARGREDRR